MRNAWIILLLLLATPSDAGNRVFDESIRSLTSIVNGDWMNRPVMQLGSDDRLRVDFDEMSHNFRSMTYHISHCEADWSISEEIFESDYLVGFNDLPIEEYQNSINTVVEYTHYSLELPNERCALKLSGNYRLTISDADNGEKLAEVEFYVVDRLVDVSLTVSANTDIDHNASHQQVDMSINLRQLRLTDDNEELQTVVMQNWTEESMRRNVRPTFHTASGLQWTHKKEYIFNAGNEYHKFEVLDVSHPTMGIENIEWDGQDFQVYPFPSVERRNYLTDVDADGAFLIRNSDRTESDYTCEYVKVNYELQAPYCGDVYIDGLWATSANRDMYKMVYDDNARKYTACILQKQGYYSYRFTDAQGRNAITEGSFYQTENKYQALVYYRPNGGRTWLLVGYQYVEFR